MEIIFGVIAGALAVAMGTVIGRFLAIRNEVKEIEKNNKMEDNE